MKNFFQLIVIQLVLTPVIFPQTGRLGFKDDLNGGLYQIFHHKQEEDLSTGTIDTNAHFKFYNANVRFGGSIIGGIIFKDNDSPFFIGDYVQLNLGTSIGKKSDNLLLGFNLGVVSSYSFTKQLTVGLKWILLGADKYFIFFGKNALYLNGMTFHPTAQYKNFWASVGFGGKTSKQGDKYKVLELEFRYNFSKNPGESIYIGMRYQTNGYKTDQISNAGVTTFRESQSIKSIGIFLGFVFDSY